MLTRKGRSLGIRNTGMKATKRRFNQLKKKLWKNPDVVNELFSNEEWLSHQQAEEPTKAQSDKMYKYILDHAADEGAAEEIPNLSKPLFYRIARYAAAAIVFVALGFALWIYQWRPGPQETENNVAATAGKAKPVTVNWEFIANTSQKVKHIHLPDLSVVDLYPHGTLKYEKGFSKPLRDIYLTGKGYFKVKKNPSRPFSVFAGGLKTTALGTSFTINTLAGHSETSVKLHTGKIVVAPALKAAKQKPVYLNTAGDGLIYNTAEQVARLLEKPVPHKPVVRKPVLETSLIRNGNVLQMKNIPLAEVIRLLSESYHVEIQSDQKDISHITFTGVVNLDKESVESVLQVIGLINDMTVTKGASEMYIIQKSNK